MRDDGPPVPIEGARSLTSVFGRWPSFHDAVVLRLLFDRETPKTGFDVEAVIHLWETTPKLEPSGSCRLIHPTRATFRFFDCDEVTLRDFNHQNEIHELALTFDEARDHERPYRAEFGWCNGLDGGLSCRRIAVLAAEPRPVDFAGH